jgi:transposase IS116/IS110/IS902 family protein
MCDPIGNKPSEMMVSPRFAAEMRVQSRPSMQTMNSLTGQSAERRNKGSSAGCSHAASHAGASDPAANDAGERVPGVSCFGIVVPQGIRHVRALIERVFGEGADTIDLPALVRTALRPLVAQLMELRLQIKTIEKKLLAWHRTSQESRRLETIPGVGFITATAIAATVIDPSHFRSSREFAAWLGTPRQNSSGGKGRLGRVSKMGNGYLRSLSLSSEPRR